MSLTSHPQSNGQTEVLNRVVEQYLRAFMHNKPASCGKFLIWAEWSYNTSWHLGTGASPYEITYGKKPFTIPQYVIGTSKVAAVDDFLTNQEAVFALFRKKLLKAQEVMKRSVDTKRRDMNFQCGDWVMVKLRPHRQSYVSNTTHSKLAKRFYGPYQIMEQIGKVAYKLNLPARSRIHPVFHCSISNHLSNLSPVYLYLFLLRLLTSSLWFHLSRSSVRSGTRSPHLPNF